MEQPFAYDCDRAALAKPLAAAFVDLREGAEAEHFLAARESHGGLRTLLFRYLRAWMSDYDAYGYLGMYDMHLLSLAQWRTLLELPESPQSRGTFLDVGAGRGDITACLTPYYALSMATELSPPLRRDLPDRGFRVLDRDLCRQALDSDACFDLITCLNVIDRVAYPKTLLSHLRDGLAQEGRLVIAVPLPLRPHVDRGRNTVSQEEPLPRCSDEGFEPQANSLVEKLLLPLGLRVVRMARAPYVCQGDAHRSMYVLDDLLVVCRHAS